MLPKYLLKNLCQANIQSGRGFVFYSCVSARTVLTTREALIFTCSSVTAPLSMPSGHSAGCIWAKPPGVS